MFFVPLNQSISHIASHCLRYNVIHLYRNVIIYYQVMFQHFKCIILMYHSNNFVSYYCKVDIVFLILHMKQMRQREVI